MARLMFGPSKRQLLHVIERERAAHAVQVGNLLDRLASAHDRPWTLPPRPVERVELSPEERDRRDYELETQEL